MLIVGSTACSHSDSIPQSLLCTVRNFVASTEDGIEITASKTILEFIYLIPFIIGSRNIKIKSVYLRILALHFQLAFHDYIVSHHVDELLCIDFFSIELYLDMESIVTPCYIIPCLDILTKANHGL